MKIIEIYQKYCIPRKLQLHMLRTAGCAELILDHWIGPKVNRKKIIRVLLLHDMGNLMKMKQEELNEEEKQVRDKYFKLYGKDDHKVSEVIGKEVGLSEEEIQMMNQKIFLNTNRIIQEEDYDVKIAAYCDQRVAPYGVCDMMERLLECKNRAKNNPESSMNNPKAERMIQCAQVMEEQVIKYCTMSKEEITEEVIKEKIKKLEIYEISKKR